MKLLSAGNLSSSLKSRQSVQPSDKTRHCVFNIKRFISLRRDTKPTPVLQMPASDLLAQKHLKICGAREMHTSIHDDVNILVK